MNLGRTTRGLIFPIAILVLTIIATVNLVQSSSVPAPPPAADSGNSTNSTEQDCPLLLEYYKLENESLASKGANASKAANSTVAREGKALDNKGHEGAAAEPEPVAEHGKDTKDHGKMQGDEPAKDADHDGKKSNGTSHDDKGAPAKLQAASAAKVTSAGNGTSGGNSTSQGYNPTGPGSGTIIGLLSASTLILFSLTS